MFRLLLGVFDMVAEIRAADPSTFKGVARLFDLGICAFSSGDVVALKACLLRLTSAKGDPAFNARAAADVLAEGIR